MMRILISSSLSKRLMPGLPCMMCYHICRAVHPLVLMLRSHVFDGLGFMDYDHSTLYLSVPHPVGERWEWTRKAESDRFGVIALLITVIFTTRVRLYKTCTGSLPLLENNRYPLGFEYDLFFCRDLVVNRLEIVWKFMLAELFIFRDSPSSIGS